MDVLCVALGALRLLVGSSGQSVPTVSLMVFTAFDVLLHLPESTGRMRLSISEPGDTGAGRWGRAGGR